MIHHPLLILVTGLPCSGKTTLAVRMADELGLPLVTKDDIKEVFLQVAIYCGVPAAVDSFRIAKEVFKELEV